MYGSKFFDCCSFTHLLFQKPCVPYFNPCSSFLAGFDSVVCSGGLLDCVSHLRDIHAARLYHCVTHDISMSVDIFNNFYLSLGDNLHVTFDTMHSPPFFLASLEHASNYTTYKMLKSALCALYYSLYDFLQSDFTTFYCLLFRNQFVHAILMHCIPQEVPGCRVCYIFLLMMRCVLLRHDFLACIRRFYIRQLTLRRNIHAFYDVGGPSRLRLIDLLYCSRDSLSAYFSLPSLFSMIQIISILMYHCTNFACFSNKGISTSSASPPSCDDQPLCHRVLRFGGGRQHEFSFLAVEPYITAGYDYSKDSAFKFVDHVDSLGQHAYPIDQNFIHTNIPLSDLIPHIPVRVALNIARLHRLEIGSHVAKSEICHIFEGHNCIYSCNQYVTVFAAVNSKCTRRRIHKAKKRSEKGSSTSVVNQKSRGEKKIDSGASHPDVVFSKHPDTISTQFPPTPVDNKLSEKIINDFCVDSLPSAIEEAGCAVCGQLIPVSQLTRLKGVKNMLHVLQATAVTRFEQSVISQSIREYKGPVLDHACDQICNDCRQQVRNGKVPHYALANGLWLGAVPNVLSSLSYIERLLAARVRVNSCFIHVASSGLRKMASHVIAFESPVPKLYQSLPPPVEDLDEVLAILFTGPKCCRCTRVA